MMCATVPVNPEGEAQREHPLEQCRNEKRHANPEDRHRQVVDDLVLARIELVLRPAAGRRRVAFRLIDYRRWFRLIRVAHRCRSRCEGIILVLSSPSAGESAKPTRTAPRR